MGIEGCYGENWSDTHSNGWERQTSTAVSQTVGKGIAHTKTSIFQCPAPTHIRPEDMGGIYETQSKCWLYQWYTFVYDKENGNVAVLATYEYDIIEKPGNIPRCVPSQCDDSTDCQECFDGPRAPESAATYMAAFMSAYTEQQSDVGSTEIVHKNWHYYFVFPIVFAAAMYLYGSMKSKGYVAVYQEGYEGLVE